MTPKSVLILAGITAVSVIAATVAVVDRADQFAKEATGVLVFPTLTDQANDVTKVIVTTNKEKVIVEKGKAGWIMKSKDGYPVNIGAVRRIVAGLASLRTIERMSRKIIVSSKSKMLRKRMLAQKLSPLKTAKENL